MSRVVADLGTFVSRVFRAKLLSTREHQSHLSTWVLLCWGHLSLPHILYFLVRLHVWWGLRVLHRECVYMIFLESKFIYIQKKMALRHY